MSYDFLWEDALLSNHTIIPMCFFLMKIIPVFDDTTFVDGYLFCISPVLSLKLKLGHGDDQDKFGVNLKYPHERLDHPV